jgi:hypothetical protein
MVMAEGDIAYELRNVEIARQENLLPGFLEINPASVSIPGSPLFSSVLLGGIVARNKLRSGDT